MAVGALPPKRRYWLLTSPRSASNLLVRILNLDAQNVRPARLGGYFFFPNIKARLVLFRKPFEEWTSEACVAADGGAGESFDALQDHIEAAEEAGETVFVKEHIFFLSSIYAEAEHLGVGAQIQPPETTVQRMRGLARATRSEKNLTCLPDEFLKTWHPTILIRHPAMMLPSLYRTAQKNLNNNMGRAQPEPYEIEATWKFVRSLYDFYRDHFGEGSQWPIVIDADDVMTSPELVAKYAGLVGLDADKLRFSWEKASEETLANMRPEQKIMLSSVNESTGVNKSKIADNIDIDAEAVKWREEFGEESGGRLERRVRDAMADYEYLHARRFK
ncbi:hypothetical protein F4861DRAFT_251339 [Xylaria intraflava]|nr:hypothetical protein F4861DRAFT_251339 [Xylaria intraflava]